MSALEPRSSSDQSTMVVSGDEPESESEFESEITAEDLEDEPPPARVGRYVLLEQVGKGGMGTVHSAFDPELERTVAVKLMYATRTQERLRREAQAIAQVSHANVISVYDVGTFESGTRLGVFMVMELVQGVELHTWLNACPRGWRAIVEVFAQAGRGLDAAHREGVIHRDFKLSNVLIDGQGRAVVLDFGLARGVGTEPEPGPEPGPERELQDSQPELDVAEDATPSASGSSLDAMLASRSLAGRSSLLTADLTRHGAVMGTPRYMSPEQHWSNVVDARSDQYSFCVSLYVALYGRSPFEAAEHMNYKALVKAKHAGVDRFEGADVPEHVVAVLRRGLKPDPADRWPDMASLVAALEHDPSRRRRQWMLGIGGPLALALVVGGGLAWDASATRACEDQSDWLASAWGEPQREAVAAAYAAVDRGYAQAALDHADAELGRYAAALAQARAEVCLADHHGELRGAALDVQRACLDERLGELSLVVARLSEADASLVEHTADVVETLPDPGQCANPDDATEVVAADGDPSQRQAIRDALFEAKLLAAEGREREALETYAGVLAQAREHGEVSLLTLVLVRGADLHGAARRLEEAEALASEGVLLAEEHGLHGLAIDGLASLGRTLSDLRGRWDDAQRVLDLAKAKYARAPGGSRGEWFLHYVQAGIDLQDKRYAEAIAEQELAEAKVEGVGSRMDLAKILHARALVDQLADHIDDAEAHVERSIALRLEIYGRDHPNLMYPYRTQARIASSRGDYQAALDRLALVIELGERHHGRDAPGLAEPHSERATALRRLGRYEEALAEYAVALRLRRVNGDPTSEELRMQSQVLLRLGRAQEALARAEEALADHRDRLGPDEQVPWLRARVIMHRGEALLALGRLDEALIDFERAAELRAAEKSDDLLVRIWTDEGHCRLGLGDVAGARAAFERARDHRAAGNEVADRYDGWLEFGLAKVAEDPAEREARAEAAIAAFLAGGGDEDLAEDVRAWQADE